jgi:prepilin-type N-terminal cleavage/methylation domain-containing protein
MKTSQRGFTLVELLVTIAITGILFSVIAGVFYQMTTISGSGNNQLTVWHELQNATNRLETDCQSALSAVGGNSLVLTDPGGGTISYTLSGTRLQRTAGSAVNTLAHNISSLTFVVSGRLVTMNITSTVVGRNGSSEQIASSVSLRPTGP